MTPDDWFSLPTPVAFRVLWDCLDDQTREALLAKEKPRLPLSPKFDRQLYKKGGSYQWASETDLHNLRYYHKRALESAAKGGEWAQKDARNAKELERWITWRECFTDTPWAGERNNTLVTAPPPCARPTVYERSGGGRAAQPPADDYIDPDTF